MDRITALDILSLHDNATAEDITKRYNVLFKKYKNSDTDGKGHTKEQMEEAYRLLMGIDYIDPENERKRKERREHPNPLFRLLRIDEEKARNAIYYYKWKALIGVVLLAIVLSTVLSIVNRVRPDLKIIIAGNINVEDTLPLENSIKAGLAGIKTPQIQCITLTPDEDREMQFASMQKLTAEIMAGKNDIYIMDLDTYRQYAANGFFAALNDKMADLGIESVDKNLEVSAENGDEGQKNPPMLYGVDVSDSPLLKDSGVMGKTLIVSLAVYGDNPRNAEEYIKKLIESVH